MPVERVPYSRDELFAVAPPKKYAGEYLREIAFPLGGIGTGCISLAGRAQLIDWEIFNRPNKGYRPDYPFFSLWAQTEGEDPVFRVLESLWDTELSGGRGSERSYGFGPLHRYASRLPRMDSLGF